MVWFFAIVMVIVLGGIAVVAAGRGESMRPVHPDRRDVTLPADRLLTAEDVRGVQFTLGVRGYRMDEVDSLLERVAEELAQRDEGRAPLDVGKKEDG